MLTSRPCSRRKRSASSFSAIFCLTLFFLRGGNTAAVLGASGSESSSSQSSYKHHHRRNASGNSRVEMSVYHLTARSGGFAEAAKSKTHLDFILNILVVKLLPSGSRKLRRWNLLLWLVVVFCSSFPVSRFIEFKSMSVFC